LDEILNPRTTSQWAIEVRAQVREIYRTEYYTEKQLSTAVYFSMFTLSEEQKVRYQALFEQQPGNSHYRRLWAARAVSSHTKYSIHDPTRFAAKASTALKGAISGIFHMTDIANIPNILKKGLTPGGDRFGRRTRADLHFTAFTIFENDQADTKGSTLAKRLRKAQKEDTQLAIISLDVDRSWSMLRTCVANGYFLPLLKARGIPTLVNVDGIEWERAKWSPHAQRVFHSGAQLAAKWATELVFDARAIENYWRQTFGAKGIFIPYGGDVPPALDVPDGLAHRGYVLLIARFVPENSVPEFFQAVPAIAAKYPVVIVGGSGYGGELDHAAIQLAASHPSVSWLGQVSNDRLLLALWQHAGVYFHGHSVGGTNPSLVQAMAASAPILARDTIYNREVLGPEGRFVNAEPEAIARTVLQMMENRIELDELARENLQRAEQHYSWPQVCEAYEHALRGLLR
jgi:glycosyltransferase involved in cell wall biosynthesis